MIATRKPTGELTATEKKLVARAELSTKRRGYVTYGVIRTSYSRRYGERERAALRKLVDRGMAKIVSSEQVLDTEAWRVERYTELVYELV